MKWWQLGILSLFSHAIIAVIFYFIGRASIEVLPPEVINLTEQQKKEIIQEAREGWLPLATAMDLIRRESYVDTIYEVKDSINIIDSVVYIPFYEYFNPELVIFDSLGYKIAIGQRTKFFPNLKTFFNSVWLKSFSTPAQKPQTNKTSFAPNKYAIGLGIGTRFVTPYYFGDFTYKLFNLSFLEMPVTARLEYNFDKEFTGAIETKLKVKF